jgi:predicted nucleic acid-binding protein
LWSHPGTRRPVAGNRHTKIITNFINTLGACGNDINDAWLAARAIEPRAALVSTDQKFARF